MGLSAKAGKGKLGAILGFGVVAVGLGLGGVARPAFAVDGWHTETRTVALNGAASTTVDLEIGAGDLVLDDGAGTGRVLDAGFAYNVDAWAPEVEYRVDRSRGRLAVRQPTERRLVFWGPDAENAWDVRLNAAVPTDLAVRLGVGDAELRLVGLNLSRLDVESGIGQTDIDLSGDWRHDLDARIVSGVGGVTVRLPTSVGVRLEVEAGLGGLAAEGLVDAGTAYGNDAYGRSPVTLRLALDAGVRRIDVAPATVERATLAEGGQPPSLGNVPPSSADPPPVGTRAASARASAGSAL